MMNIPIKRIHQNMIELYDQKTAGFNPRVDMVLRDGREDKAAFVTIEVLTGLDDNYIFSGFLSHDLLIRSSTYPQETDVKGWYNEKERSGILTIFSR